MMPLMLTGPQFHVRPLAVLDSDYLPPRGFFMKDSAPVDSVLILYSSSPLHWTLNSDELTGSLEVVRLVRRCQLPTR